MPEAVTASGAFIGPGTCRSVPAKSTVRRSPCLVTRMRIRNVRSSLSPSSRMPSPSQKSSKVAVPSGSPASMPRIMRSE